MLSPVDPTRPDFWYLTFYGEQYRKVFEPMRAQRSLRDELLLGVPVARNWTPPKYELSERGSWPDWMAFWVPLLSDKAVSALHDLIAPHCQFLPWIKEEAHAYTLLNITTEIPRQNWSCQKSSICGDTYIAADVIELHGVAVPDLFRLEGYRGKFFVSDALARRSFELSFKGAAFIDPAIPAMNLAFIPMRFGRKGTGFIRRKDDLGASAHAAGRT
jgi:hypothetical protein